MKVVAEPSSRGSVVEYVGCTNKTLRSTRAVGGYKQDTFRVKRETERNWFSKDK